MKFSTLRAFQKHIEGAEKAGFSPLYLILSAEGGDRRVALDCLVAALAKKEKIDSFGIRSLSDTTGKMLDQELNTLSMFSPKKIVVAGGADEFDKAAEAIALKGGPAGVFLILHGVSGAKSFYKAIEKQGIILELGAEKSWEKEKNAQEWIVGRFLQEGKRIDPLAAQLLAKETGAEIGMLEQEVQKLIAFTMGRMTISRADIAAISCGRPTVTVFQLSEALFKRDLNGTVRIFRELLDDGQSYFAILKQLRGQILTQLEIASILRQGGGPEEVTRSYPYMKGFILEKNLEIARTWGFDRLKRALVRVDDFEIRAKEGTPDYELLADLLTLKLL